MDQPETNTQNIHTPVRFEELHHIITQHLPGSEIVKQCAFAHNPMKN